MDHLDTDSNPCAHFCCYYYHPSMTISHRGTCIYSPRLLVLLASLVFLLLLGDPDNEEINKYIL